MCAVINPIIAQGTTTAHRRPFDQTRMVDHYIAPPRGLSCVVALRAGLLLGFQAVDWADPAHDGPDPLPEGWGSIGSFVAPEAQGLGLGHALFATTLAAARRAGVIAIDATIRADNRPGLGFYHKLGFRDYAVIRAVPLSDGAPVDRMRKRYDVTAQT